MTHTPRPDGPSDAPGDDAPVQPAARVRTAVRVPVRCDTEVLQATLTTFDGLVDGLEHLAVRLGPQDTPVPLVRLHSECLTGDVFSSARCDCGAQLHEALRRIGTVGGTLLYMRQEGRGIGLYNKLDAYRLQDHGLDTYAANRALGLADDLRDYAAAAQILTALGHREIDLLTNNPDKRGQLARHGIRVRHMVHTGVYMTAHNADYLKAKATLTSHTISLEGVQT